jgi:SH3-like domain-containing protein
VITADESRARSADSRLAALAYPEPLPAGVEVEMLEERMEWARVRLYNGRDVWVRGSNVTRVVE